MLGDQINLNKYNKTTKMLFNNYSRRSQGEYSPKITEPEANNCFSIFIFSKRNNCRSFVY